MSSPNPNSPTPRTSQQVPTQTEQTPDTLYCTPHKKTVPRNYEPGKKPPGTFEVKVVDSLKLNIFRS